MGEKSAANLEELCRKALGMGATAAIEIAAQNIVLDPRVRMKCRIPLCPEYGKNLMCPPNVISPDEFAEAVSRYDRAIILRVEIPFAPSQVATIEKAGSLSELRGSEGLRPTLVEGFTFLSHILGRMEAACFKMGYSFAAALGAGSCKLCDECVTQGSGLPCKHPFEARPSMEAVGIDVFSTAERAGISLSRSAAEGVSWIGLVLVD